MHKFYLPFILLCLLSFKSEAQQPGDFLVEGELGYAVADEQEGLSIGANVGYSITSLIAVKAGYSKIELSSDVPKVGYSINKYSLFGEFIGFFSEQFGVAGILGGSLMDFKGLSDKNQSGVGLDIGTKLRYIPTSQFVISLKLNNNFNTENDYIITAGLSLQYRLR